MTSPNYIDSTGLITETVDDIVTTLQDGFKAIYGPDINLNVNSPDAQMINLFAQAVIDTLDCITQVYNAFNPQLATGAVLDQRVVINGLVRQSATFTRTNVNVTIDRSVTLQGIDTNPTAAFTVQDNTGNKFSLEVTISLPSAGVYTLEFISAVPGQIETTPNTITTISTIQLGVLAVNNPDSAIATGSNQESDVALRLRQTQATALPSQGYLQGLIGALLGVSNVIYATVYENNGNTTDVYGIPGHSIWCVVDGGSNADIAEVIYNKRNAGCGMYGSVLVSVPQINGFNFIVKFDRPDYENLYITLTIQSIKPSHIIDATYLKQVIYNQVVYGIYEPSDYTEITTVVKEADPLAVVLSGGVSIDGITYSPFLYPSTLAGRFLLSISRITIITV